MSGRRRGGGGEVGGGVGVARNKRGTPMYSREDIREQYCINDKELHALESSKRKPIFGCLTSSNTQPSPCKKKSLLPACLRGRVPSDENIYTKSQSAHTSPAHRKGQETIDYEDDTYFRRRPKTICYTDPRRLASLDDSLAKSGRVSRPRSDAGNASYESYLNEDAGDDPNRRPNQLAITSGEYHSTEILQDNGNREGYTVRRTAYTQPNTPDMGHSTRFHQVTTPEVFLDDRPQKHVSFQKAMSRSATVGGLEDHGTMTRDDSGRGSVKSGGSRSQERLLDGRRTPDYIEQRALDQLLAPVLTKALLQEPDHKKERKHAGRDKRGLGGHQGDSEAGSRSESRSRSRTPSLRRRKIEKRTIGIQTDEVPYDFDFPASMEGLPSAYIDDQVTKTEHPSQYIVDKKVGKKQKKPKKKLPVEEEEEAPVVIVPETPIRKGSVHFSDDILRSDPYDNSEVSTLSMKKKSKKKSEDSEIVQERESRHSKKHSVLQEPVREKQKQATKDSNRKLTKPEIQQDSKHHPRPPENTKVSMGMQTDNIIPFLPANSIFMTEDLDTSTDWHGEESSVDWHTSAGSLAYHTDASSFAWHTDVSSYGRQTDASSLSCRGDSSFAPDSCEEEVEESEGENIMNMDIDLIKERKLDMSQNQSAETSEQNDLVEPICNFKTQVEEIEDQGEQVQENVTDSQEENNPSIMVRRLRFQRQLAEDFLQKNKEYEERRSNVDIQTMSSLNNVSTPLVEESCLEQQSHAQTLPSKSRLPKKSKLPCGSSKEEGDNDGPKENQTEMNPLETCRTWPKSFNEQERTDDINLKGFQPLSETSKDTHRRRKKEKPEHKTSWLEINLIKKEVDRAETPKCIQISNSQLNQNIKKSDLKIDKQNQQADISDEYPKSEHDYKSDPTVSSSKKSSLKSDGVKSLQRRKKVTQKESSDSSTSHQQEIPNQENRKTKSPSSPLSRLKESLPFMSKEKLNLESPRMSTSTDTSTALALAESVEKRTKKSKKSTASQAKEDKVTKDASKPNNIPLNRVIEEESETRESIPKDCALPIDEENSRPSRSSSLRRKRSLKKGTSKYIQTELSYDEPLEDYQREESHITKDYSNKSEKQHARNMIPSEFSGKQESKSDHLNQGIDLKSETVSIRTNASSLRRMKKVRKATTYTQTEQEAIEDPFGDFERDDNHMDSVSVRTSSLRRIRKAIKRSVSIQTDLCLPIYNENLHLSILDFEGVRDSEIPKHSDSLIYVNIPAAFLEIGESGNDADISDEDSDNETGVEHVTNEKIYLETRNGKIIDESQDDNDVKSEETENINELSDNVNNEMAEEKKSPQYNSDENLYEITESQNYSYENPRESFDDDGSVTQEGDRPDLNETYVISDEIDTRQEVDDEDSSEEDEDFDNYIIEQQEGNDDKEIIAGVIEDDVEIVEDSHIEDDKPDIVQVHEEQAEFSTEFENRQKLDKDRSSPQQALGESSNYDLLKYAELNEVLASENPTHNVSLCQLQEMPPDNKENIQADQAIVDVNVETADTEDQEHDSGVSEEEIREVQDDGLLVANRWYFGAQDKTFDGTDENKRQDTVIYRSTERRESDERVSANPLEPDNLNSNKIDEASDKVHEESRVNLARKTFREMKYPFGKGHFSEGDANQALVYFENIDTYDSIDEEVQLKVDRTNEIRTDSNLSEENPTEVEHDIADEVIEPKETENFKSSTSQEIETASKERKIIPDITITETLSLEEEPPIEFRSQCDEVSEEPTESTNMEKASENTPAVEPSGTQLKDVIEDKNQDPKSFPKNVKASENSTAGKPSGTQLKDFIEDKNEDLGCLPRNIKASENTSADEPSGTQLKEIIKDKNQDPEYFPKNVKSSENTSVEEYSGTQLKEIIEVKNQDPKSLSKKVKASQNTPVGEPSRTPLKEVIEDKDQDLKSFMKNIQASTDEGDENSKCEEEGSIRSTSVTTIMTDDESYRESSPSENLKDNNPNVELYDHGDAISLAMASEYGYTLSEEEDDEVIVFTYKKVKRTIENERWKSYENLVNNQYDESQGSHFNEPSISNQTDIGAKNIESIEIENSNKDIPCIMPTEKKSEKDESQKLVKGSAVDKTEASNIEEKLHQVGKQILQRRQAQINDNEIVHAADISKKKKRPRNKKKNKKPETTKGEGDDKESALSSAAKAEENITSAENFDQELVSVQKIKHRLWADEIEENLSNEWKSCGNDEGASGISITKDPSIQEVADEKEHPELERGDRTADTSYCDEDDDDESNRFDGDSNQYEKDNISGEGGVEQNAYEEYLLIGGDSQEEMKEVDRIFRDVLENYGEDFSSDLDDINQLQKPNDKCEESESKEKNMTEFSASKTEESFNSVNNPSLQSNAVGSSMIPEKIPRIRKSKKLPASQDNKGKDIQPPNTLESGNKEKNIVTSGVSSSSKTEETETLITLNNPSSHSDTISSPIIPEKIPRSRKPKKLPASQVKKGEDIRPADTMEG